MNKIELLRKLRDKIGKQRIAFPNDLGIEGSEEEIKIKMGHGAVCGNMQTDVSAFEGWILVIKAALDCRPKFILEWDDPAVESGHYRKFLYRVKKYYEIFGGSKGWFRPQDARNLSKLKMTKDSIYMLNAPASSGDQRLCCSSREENSLENRLVRETPPILKEKCPNGLERQLPVGVFNGAIRRDQLFFTGGKSAIDLWGIREKTLCLFELKTAKNTKVGVLSELFFYAMLEHDEQNGWLKRDGEVGDKIRATNQIEAYILAPKCHPLITKAVFKLLNDALKERRIHFDYLELNLPTKC